MFLNDIDTLLPTAHSLANKVVKISYTNINNNNNMIFKTQQNKVNKPLKRSNVVTSNSNSVCKCRNQLQCCKSANNTNANADHISQLNQNELIEYIHQILAINNQLTNELNELKYNSKTKQPSRQQCNYIRQCKTKSNTPNNTSHNVNNGKYKSSNQSPSFKQQQKKIKVKDVHNIRNKMHSVYDTSANSNTNNHNKQKKPTYTRSAKQIFTGLIKPNQQGKPAKVLTMSNSINKCVKNNISVNNNSIEYFLPKTRSINNCVMKNIEENSKRKETYRKQADKMCNSHECVPVDKHQQQQQQQRFISRYKIQQRELDLKAFEKYSEDLLSISNNNNNNNSTNGINVNSNRCEADVINIVENYKTLNDENNANTNANRNEEVDEDEKYIEAYDLPLQLESFSNKRNKAGIVNDNNKNINSISLKVGNEYYTYNHDEEEMKLDSTGRKYAKERMNVIKSNANIK